MLGRPAIWGFIKRYDGRAETESDTPEQLIIIVVVVVHTDKSHTAFRKEKVLAPLVRDVLILNDPLDVNVNVNVNVDVDVDGVLVYSSPLTDINLTPYSTGSFDWILTSTRQFAHKEQWRGLCYATLSSTMVRWSTV